MQSQQPPRMSKFQNVSTGQLEETALQERLKQREVAHPPPTERNTKRKNDAPTTGDVPPPRTIPRRMDAPTVDKTTCDLGGKRRSRSQQDDTLAPAKRTVRMSEKTIMRTVLDCTPLHKQTCVEVLESNRILRAKHEVGVIGDVVINNPPSNTRLHKLYEESPMQVRTRRKICHK